MNTFVIVMFVLVILVVIVGVRDMVEDYRNDKMEKARIDSENNHYEKLKQFTSRKLVESPKYDVWVTTSWHLRHRDNPYYLRVVGKGEYAGREYASDLCSTPDEAESYGGGQCRWYLHLNGMLSLQSYQHGLWF